MGGIANTILTGVTSFASLIQSQGLANAFENLVMKIFGRKAEESIKVLSGMAALLAKPKTDTILNGQQAKELKINDTDSLYFDLVGNFIGKKEGGVTQVGTFGVNSKGTWGLVAGKVIGSILGDLVFAGTIADGQLGSMTVSNQLGTLLTGGVEGGTGPIIIDGRDPVEIPDPSRAPSFWNVVLKVLPYAIDLFLKSGVLQKSEKPQAQGSLSTSPASNKELYVLVNGVGNPNVGPPDYLNNLQTDLNTQSQGQIKLEDILKSALYTDKLAQFWHTDKVTDVLQWLLESQNTFVMLNLSGQITADLVNYFKNRPFADRLRPIVGMGFSGGFAPLAKALKFGGFQVKTMVGLAPGILSLREIPIEVTNLIFQAAEKIDGGVTQGLKEILDVLFKKISVVGDIASLIGSIIGFVGSSTEKAFEKLREGLAKLLEQVPFGLPTAMPSSLEAIANVWGTNDWPVKLGLVGGYRDQLLGLTTAAKQIFNIEIKGATHSNYMRRDDLAINNPKVNDFVTRLIERSRDKNQLKAFLESDFRVHFNAERNVYEVTP